MESVVRLIDKLKIDNSLIKFCRNQLLTVEDVVSLKSKLDWRIKLKINIEYDLSYDKLYLGPWSQVPEEHRRMFQVLSFLKSYCIVVDLTNQTLENLLNALHVLDIGIIVETGSEESDLLSVFAQQLHEIMGESFVQQPRHQSSTNSKITFFIRSCESPACYPHAY